MRTQLATLTALVTTLLLAPTASAIPPLDGCDLSQNVWETTLSCRLSVVRIDESVNYCPADLVSHPTILPFCRDDNTPVAHAHYGKGKLYADVYGPYPVNVTAP